MSSGIFSIGHSTQAIGRLVETLKLHQVEIVADVRSAPFSRFNPQFNREELASALRDAGIKYLFLGKELGARADDPSCYVSGKVKYSKLAERAEFKSAISRLIKGAEDFRIVLLCAEKEPLECHRTILVSQELQRLGCEVKHILHDGTIEPHAKSLERLLDLTGTPKSDLFKSREDLVCEALERQESRIAYQESGT